MAAAERRIDAEELRRVVRAVFERCGMAPEDAQLLADTLVDADLSGIHSHGVLRVPEYIEKLTTKGVNPRGKPTIVREYGACLVVDGGNSMGQIGMNFAMQQVIAKAESHGIAAAAVRGSNHSGAMAYYVRQALPHDMIGMATTNALPTMAPWGGAERLLGINPLGMAIPTGAEQPIVYDAAFSGSSHGKIRIYQQKGLTLPEGWALDSQGQPTTDPAIAIDGLLAPIGGFKGTGLALIMGILSSMLSGAAYGLELGNMDDGPEAGLDGHFVAAIKVAAFVDVNEFKERVDKAISELHHGKPAVGVSRIYAPGEIEAERRFEYGRNGIPLNSATLQDLANAATRLNVAANFIS
ncbi:MAG TPA: Ldh family oxidoreductase [Caldilineaceae bacterium]|nr:Ldh family oxidoreductase [Caldilineaceae bacterium]